MSIEIIQNRLEEYSRQSIQEEENAIKEIYQEIALSALSRSGFFKLAAFQGGTCLRIIYNLQRFSEDLDFVLINPNKNFIWEPFFIGMQQEFMAYGIDLNAIDRARAERNVQKAFLKDDSFAKVFKLSYNRARSNKKFIEIKFEIDINPPMHSQVETHYLDFPSPFSVTTQDKPSLFASKCHALLCRNYLKGRDWYDFIWYVGKKNPVNFTLLKEALIQTNQWPLTESSVLTKEIFIDLLKEKIMQIDWQKAAEDVKPFVKKVQQDIFDFWSTDYFLSYLFKLKDYLE